MTERLEQLNHRYEELSVQLSAPETYNDPALAARLNREQRELEPVVQAWRDLAASERELADAEALLHDEDEALRILAREEFPALKAAVERKREALQILLLPRDPADEKDVIIEVRAGVGGEEAALFAHSLCRMYSMYADAKGWSVQMANMNQTELGGVKEAVFSISGQGAYSRLKYESGVHRVQRVPETESGGRIHTSTATVAVLPQVDEVEFELDMNEVRIDTFRSSGAGGQHIQKTDSAVRITHLPTGMGVECQDERSQKQNKARAMAVLASRLYAQQVAEQHEREASERKNLIGSGDRSERIRTYNYPQGRVTDHRINLTLYRLEAIMNGDLEEIITALTTEHQAAALAELA